MDEAFGNAGAVRFFVEPTDAIVTLARLFVLDQRQLAKARQMADTLPAAAPADAVAEVRKRISNLEALWVEKVPHIAASFQLALEVLDTYGPEGVRVEDPMDTAIWDNKYFVWLREFGGTPPDQQDDANGGAGS
ncbi:hypothetical protein [Mycolicibacterium mageritense]|uniref:hypothetical protein n=1 Tax=Mycolicibacterium mageritense TaxID=53462 RepID=UPI0011D666D0|nr:hypothetical protein [Mycolicibacterium mageritense]TXI51951.1 MAG: hypothetical protein E6Q55_37845 [Mycolicibacterium mageritense]